MNWIIYNRVSTEDQVKWVSLEYQTNSCLRFADENKININKENIFLESYSWAFFDRPKLWQIFELIKSWNIDCIIVLRRDRLARDVYVYNKILNEFEEQWVKIFYSEEALTWEENIDDFMGNTLIWFAQYEKNMIKKRTYSWRLQKSRNWKWTTQVPYWYIKTRESLLELYEPEVKIIKLVVSLYLKENKKIWEIVWYCNDNKILPPSMSEKETATQLWIQQRRKNASMFWGYSAVHTIIKNVEKYYIWEYKAFSTIYKKIWSKSIIIWKRDEKDIITIPIPKIFDENIAIQINEKRRINKNHSEKKGFRTYLLKSKLFCDCQTDLRNFKWYYNNKKELRNYRCTMSDKRKTSSDRLCKNSISWLKIDTLVIDTLKDFFLDYNKFMIEYSDNNKGENDNIDIVTSIKYEIHKLEEKEKRALDLCLDWMLDKEKLKEIQDENKDKIKKLNEKIKEEYDSIYNEYKQSLLDWEVKDYVKKIHSYALKYFEEASYEELKKVVDLIIDKVIVSTDKNKPIRIILNVFPWEFDFDTYLEWGREVVREFNKEKTQLSNYQVEFSPNLQTNDSSPLEWWDFAFINFLKENVQLFINGGPSGARTQDLILKRDLLYQLS